MNIKEIAKLAGVSSATISRVLNNSGYVGEETRERVLRIVNEHNYVPSAIARSLSIQDSLSVGVIIPDIENEFFSKVMSGINEAAEKYSYNMIFMGTDETLDKEHGFLKIVESQRLKGVIITPISEKDETTREYLERFRSKGIPVILIDRDVKGKKFDGVFVDNFKGAYEGVEELIKAGHRRIAIITGPETSRPGRDRYKGYLAAMRDAGLEVPERYIQKGDFKISKAYSCMESLLSLPEPPSAIFTSNNLTTLGCLKYITEKNMKIGRDIALLGFDDIEALKIIDYRISVIDRDAKEQGRQAMNLLGEYFSGKRSKSEGERRIIIPYQVILRGSERTGNG